MPSVRPLLIALVALAGPVSQAHAAGFSAGAGLSITTPPQWSTDGTDHKATGANAAYAPEFATLCPAALFPDHGVFALQEPFRDDNGNGHWDANSSVYGPPDDPPPPPTGPPEAYCDANGNGRWDGLYTSGHNDAPATGVHDDIDARAFAVSYGGGRPLVYVSVVQQGLFENYTDAVRTRLDSVYHVAADVVVSANHNESSPDTVGIYGPLTLPQADVSGRSGIDEYFTRWLVDHIAQAAAQAVARLEPARLFAIQTTLPPAVTQRYSDQFPTFDTLTTPRSAAAIDTKVGVLQARKADGRPIFTVLSYAAHNQEMGRRPEPEFSGDWPAFFARDFESAHGGVAMFLVGDNGSQEDPQAHQADGSLYEPHEGGPAQPLQSQMTGLEFSHAVAAAAPRAQELRPGAVALARTPFCVPLENSGFAGLAAAGEFGQRQAWNCTPDGTPVAPSGPTGSQFRTYVSVGSIGPDLQLIGNPGEAFPALMVGSPFTKDEESCDAPNPAVPTWHARAPFRFQVGLADDMIGYMEPAWAWVAEPPQLFPTACQADAHNQKHKLEDEGVGPKAANAVADRLAALLDSAKDPAAHIRDGRYVKRDGTVSARPAGAVAVLLAPPGATALTKDTGRLVGLPGVSGIGGRAVDATGLFMDYDGQPQPGGPDVLTRGMVVFDRAGCATERDYVSVFDPLPAPALGAADGSPDGTLPGQDCTRADGTQAGAATDTAPGSPAGGRSPGAGKGSAVAVSGSGAGASRCVDRSRPRAIVSRRHRVLRPGLVRLHGSATDRDCRGHRAAPARVTMSLHLDIGRRCRFLGIAGVLGPPRSCRRPVLLLAHGRGLWNLTVRPRRIPAGRYRITVRAVDRAGNVSRSARVALRVRVRPARAGHAR